MSIDPSVRIGDAEREHVVAALGQHLSVGRLTMNEFESRLDTVYAARTRGELDAVLADLPTTAPPPPHPPPPRLVPSAGRPWTPWALAGGISLLIWVTTSFAQGHPLYFWPIWMIAPWGVVLLAQAVMARPGYRSGRPSTKATHAAGSR
jgi:hypothetical protein